MDLIQPVYDKLVLRQKDLEDRRAESQTALTTYSKDGDLSENNDYIQEKQNLENIEQELWNVKDLLKRSNIININTSGRSQIALGVPFDLVVKSKGNFFDLNGTPEENTFHVGDNNQSEISFDGQYTSIKGTYMFGGPTDICESQNILASDSPIAKQLLGKSLGLEWSRLEWNERDVIIEFREASNDSF